MSICLVSLRCSFSSPIFATNAACLNLARTDFSFKIKLTFPQRSNVFRPVRLPKDNVLRYGWLKVTEARLLLADCVCHKKVEFSECEPIRLDKNHVH